MERHVLGGLMGRVVLGLAIVGASTSTAANSWVASSIMVLAILPNDFWSDVRLLLKDLLARLFAMYVFAVNNAKLGNFVPPNSPKHPTDLLLLQKNDSSNRVLLITNCELYRSGQGVNCARGSNSVVTAPHPVELLHRETFHQYNSSWLNDLLP